ncbi:Ger(x)C family spore germination C-terminal domain-containing protein [Salinithrix halophila]|uniref:Ger(X)C family spore germination C-terminal domain-containing protein n=1 Tax=Salinithrix halophila TaxID=1485204 RepID=A0ABV8JHU8_9BACL
MRLDGEAVWWRNPAGYVIIEIKRNQVKRKCEVLVRPNGNVEVRLDVKLLGTVSEFPMDQVNDEKTMKRLNKTLSKILTRESEELVRKLQKAHCDAFCVARQLIAFNPEVRKKKKWFRDYPRVRFKPKVEVEIVGDGILN